MDKLFGTSGIRGSANDLFTNQFCFDIGRTFAIFLAKHKQTGPVSIGMDPRESSPRIKQYLAAGLDNEGIKVFDEGIVPSPAVCYLLQKEDIAGGIMVTGSHIKAELNGIKFFVYKEEISKEHEKEIEEIYENIKLKVSANYKYPPIIKEGKAKRYYREMLAGLIEGEYPNYRIVVDPGNGTQSQIMSNVLSAAGINVIPINDEETANFLARDTESEYDFEDLKKAVIINKAMLGIGYDSDGDRVVFVDEDGRFIMPDYISTLIAKNEETESVVAPITVSQIIDTIDKKVIRTKVGSPYVIEEMKKAGSLFGFEANGGSIFANIMLTRDGGSPTIKVLNLLIKSGKTLKQLINEMPVYYIYKSKVDCPFEFEDRVLEGASKTFKGIKTEIVDGLKIWIDDNSWVNFRISKNSPEFRVFAESDNKDKATKLGEDSLELVKNIIHNASQT